MMISNNLWGYDSHKTNNKSNNVQKELLQAKKLKSFYIANEAINKVKKQSSQWE